LDLLGGEPSTTLAKFGLLLLRSGKTKCSIFGVYPGSLLTMSWSVRRLGPPLLQFHQQVPVNRSIVDNDAITVEARKNLAWKDSSQRLHFRKKKKKKKGISKENGSFE